MKKIKSQKEANKVFEYLVKSAVDTLSISKDQAEKRVKALLDSGVLASGNLGSPHTQMKIDEFMNTPI